MRRSRELLGALLNAQAGGPLAHPPGLDGQQGLGIAGISGAPRGRTWDAVASAHRPLLAGSELIFVALDDGSIVVADELPDEATVPLAEAIEKSLEPPYRAAAVRTEGDLWTAVAEAVVIVELPGLDADDVDVTFVGGQRELSLDGVRADRELPGLDAIADAHADVALHAERVDGHVYAVDVFSL